MPSGVQKSPVRSMSPSRAQSSQPGFTLPEVLVVAGVIAVLLAVLLPALRGGWDTANMAKSQSRMKQIFQWMQLYSGENREVVLPSQFNYQDPSNPNNPAGNVAIKVCSDESRDANGTKYRGTWADILWTQNGLGKNQALVDPNQAANLDKYMYHAPDEAIFENNSTYDESPFRSSAPNTADFYTAPNAPGTGPRPYGTGASESGLPGFFAANNYFNQDPLALAGAGTALTARWWTTGQIKNPGQSMYLVDSIAGEIINPNDDPGLAGAIGDPYNNAPPSAGQVSPMEVDFRYNGACLMMFLDGHSAPQTPWDDLDDLETNRKVRVRSLDRNW